MSPNNIKRRLTLICKPLFGLSSVVLTFCQNKICSDKTSLTETNLFCVSIESSTCLWKFGGPNLLQRLFLEAILLGKFLRRRSSSRHCPRFLCPFLVFCKNKICSDRADWTVTVLFRVQIEMGTCFGKLGRQHSPQICHIHYIGTLSSLLSSWYYCDVITTSTR